MTLSWGSIMFGFRGTQLVMGLTLLVLIFFIAGCSTSGDWRKTSPLSNICTNQDDVLHAAHTKVENLTTELARVQIKAAKQQADLHSARHELQSLRRTRTSLQQQLAQLQSLPVHTTQVPQAHQISPEPQTFDSRMEKHSVNDSRLLTINSDNIIFQNFESRIEKIELKLKELHRDLKTRTPTPWARDETSSHELPHDKHSKSLDDDLRNVDVLAPTRIYPQSGTQNERWLGKIPIIVQKGDTLSKLARRSGASIKSLKSLNSLNSDVIYIGQQLFLPELKSIH